MQIVRVVEPNVNHKSASKCIITSKMGYNNIEPCLECDNKIDLKVFTYSVSNFGIPLCRDCQSWLKEKELESTKETISLYFELKKRGVPAELEKFDGYKTIDIAVTHAKVNIEVDGGQHNFNAKQAMSDLQRTYYSFKKGFLTLRIPNSLVRYHFDETADLITDFLVESRDRKHKKYY